VPIESTKKGIDEKIDTNSYSVRDDLGRGLDNVRNEKEESQQRGGEIPQKIFYR